MVIPPNFNELPEVEKFRMVLNKPENVKYTGQFVINIFDIRSKVVNKIPVLTISTLYHMTSVQPVPSSSNSYVRSPGA